VTRPGRFVRAYYYCVRCTRWFIDHPGLEQCNPPADGKARRVNIVCAACGGDGRRGRERGRNG
jgi:hypothetical protein